MAFKRAFNYQITAGVLGHPDVSVEVSEHHKAVLFKQSGDGEHIVTIRFDELFDLLHVLEEIRKEFVIRPHGGRD